MHAKYTENFLAYISYSTKVNYDYTMKENHDRILTEFFQSKVSDKLKFRSYS